MKPILIIALGLAMTGTAAVTFAQTAAQPAGERQTRHAKLDINGDGVIDRSEAAKAPKFAEHFDKFDANKDGRITADERPQRGARGDKSGHGDRMAQLDTNKDGVIDRSEAAKAPKFAEHFDRLDANKDGRITADERPQRGARGGKGGHGDRMAQLDANNDGVIDRSEAAKAPKFAENFDRLDANKDGRITADERPQRGARGGKGGQGDRMAQLDINKDGVIDRSEAAKAPKFAEHFDKFDANKDGRITVDERPQRGMKSGRGDRMAQLDADKDGRFSRQELAGKDRVLQNFAAIDTNSDGFLSREEMQAHHKAHRGERGAPRQQK